MNAILDSAGSHDDQVLRVSEAHVLFNHPRALRPFSVIKYECSCEEVSLSPSVLLGVSLELDYEPISC